MKNGLLMIAAVFVLLAQAASANLISDAGFETAWDPCWKSWGNYQYLSTAGSYMDNDGNLGGTLAGVLLNTDNAYTGFYQDSTVTPVAGEIFAASVYLTVDANTVYDQAFIKLDYFDGGGANITSYTNMLNFGTLTAGTWSYYDISGAAPSGAATVRINIGVNNITTAGNLYVDGASLVSVPEPVSATLLGLGLVGVYALRRKMKK